MHTNKGEVIIMTKSVKKAVGPEKMLNSAIKDIKKSGLDGLDSYLTPNGVKKVKMVKSFSGGMGLFGNMLVKSNPGMPSPKAVKFLLSNMSKFDWKVNKVTTNENGAKAVLAFQYKDKVDGTIGLTLIQEKDQWKIDDLDIPKFKKMEV